LHIEQTIGAAAIAGEIILLMRSKLPVTPLKIISKALNINAPMASLIETPTNDVANKAAPGVDHAVRIGFL